MKTLPLDFISKKWHFKQVCREKNWAIYKRWHEDWPENVHYEVIQIQKHNGMVLGGNQIPPSEYYPNSNSWGTLGFTCHTREAAYKKLGQMVNDCDLNIKK